MTKLKKDGTLKKSGGKRAGAGKPKTKPRTFSDKLKLDVMKELSRIQSEGGKSYGELLVTLAFDEKTTHTIRGIALKLISEMLIVKETKKTIEEVKKPGVYLPEYQVKPNLEEDRLDG